MILSLIAACSSNRVIGIENKLPWHIPEDLKFFREKTKNRIVILGRKTFDSIGAKPLPNRFHIVISRTEVSESSQFENLIFVTSLDKALEKARILTGQKESIWSTEVFVIGGAEIYRQSISSADRIYLTLIHQKFQGDTFFPEVPDSIFKIISNIEKSGNPSFSFIVYEKRV